MKNAKFLIIGRKPCLQHKFNLDVLTNTSKPKEGTAGNNPNEWRVTCWSDGKKLYIPSNYLFSCFVSGGKHVKVGRGTISKNLAGTLEIVGEKNYFENRELPKDMDDLSIEDIGTDSSKNVYVDVRMVANPNTKGRNIRYRVAIKEGWEVNCEIVWDDSVISPDQMQFAIEASGKFVGLSDDRAIGGGRFTIEEYRLID